jgi:hypothetical protein
MNMNRMKVMIAIAVLSLAGVAVGQAAKPGGSAKSAKKAAAAPDAGPQSIAKILDGQLAQIEAELVPAVEAMPDDKFDFAPTNGEFATVRTFALQARHVATTNYWLYALMSGQKNPIEMGKDENGADTLNTKADIVKYVKDSYEFSHKALAAVPASAWTTSTISMPFGSKTPWTPLAVAVLLQGHQFDHYGQMVEYLRMNGIVPPASRPRQ